MNVSSSNNTKYTIQLEHLRMKILDVIENKTTITFESRKAIFEDANPRLEFMVGELYPIQGGLNQPVQRYAVGLGGNDYIEFESVRGTSARQAAEQFIEGIDEADRTNTRALRRAAGNRPIRSFDGFRNLASRLAAKGTISQFSALANIPRAGPTLTKILSSPVWAGFFRILGAATLSADIYFSSIEVINDLENEAREDPNREEELFQLRNILIAQMHVQIGLTLYQVMRTASLFRRALSAIKWTVRSIQGAAALSGVGTVPSLLSLIVTEAGWFVAGFVIANPTVQRAIAEWIQDSMFAGIFDIAGQGISGAYQILDTALDGAFGTDAMRRNLGWDNDRTEAAEGEMVTNSEWAKLVFHGLLFPPGAEKHLVPYINPNERTRLLQEKLGVTATDSEQPEAGAEPGMDTGTPLEVPENPSDLLPPTPTPEPAATPAPAPGPTDAEGRRRRQPRAS